MPARPRQSLLLPALALCACSVAFAAAPAPSLEERVRRLEALVETLQLENAALRRAAPPAVAVPAPPPVAAAEAAPAVTFAPGPSSLRLSGEVRARLTSTWYGDPAGVARDQLLLRVRFGVLAAFGPEFEAGFRFTAGDPHPTFQGSALSDQFAAGDNASRKPAFFDLAFLRWHPALAGDTRAALTLGKTANLFATPSRLLFDSDYQPEGLTAEAVLPLASTQRLALAAGLYLLDDLPGSARDPGLAAARARWEAAWSPAWSSAFAFAAFGISHPDTLVAANIANYHRGNTRTPAGVLVHGYRPLHAEAALTHRLARAPGYAGSFPVTLRAEFLHNPAAPAARDGWVAGLDFGSAARAGQWSVGYQHMRIEADAWFEEFLDGDHGGFYRSVPLGWNTDPASLAGGHGGGTGLRSHALRTSWSPRDYLVFNANLFLNDLLHPPVGTDGRARRLQLETLLRF